VVVVVVVVVVLLLLLPLLPGSSRAALSTFACAGKELGWRAVQQCGSSGYSSQPRSG